MSATRFGESTGNPSTFRTPTEEGPPMLQLGVITYNIAKDWDLDTILKKLDALSSPALS